MATRHNLARFPPWQVNMAEDGRLYYYNEANKTSTYTTPLELQEVPEVRRLRATIRQPPTSPRSAQQAWHAIPAESPRANSPRTPHASMPQTPLMSPPRTPRMATGPAPRLPRDVEEAMGFHRAVTNSDFVAPAPGNSDFDTPFANALPSQSLALDKALQQLPFPSLPPDDLPHPELVQHLHVPAASHPNIGSKAPPSLIERSANASRRKPAPHSLVDAIAGQGSPSQDKAIPEFLQRQGQTHLQQPQQHTASTSVLRPISGRTTSAPSPIDRSARTSLAMPALPDFGHQATSDRSMGRAQELFTFAEPEQQATWLSQPARQAELSESPGTGLTSPMSGQAVAASANPVKVVTEQAIVAISAVVAAASNKETGQSPKEAEQMSPLKEPQQGTTVTESLRSDAPQPQSSLGGPLPISSRPRMSSENVHANVEHGHALCASKDLSGQQAVSTDTLERMCSPLGKEVYDHSPEKIHDASLGRRPELDAKPEETRVNPLKDRLRDLQDRLNAENSDLQDKLSNIHRQTQAMESNSILNEPTRPPGLESDLAPLAGHSAGAAEHGSQRSSAHKGLASAHRIHVVTDELEALADQLKSLAVERSASSIGAQKSAPLDARLQESLGELQHELKEARSESQRLRATQGASPRQREATETKSATLTPNLHSAQRDAAAALATNQALQQGLAGAQMDAEVADADRQRLEASLRHAQQEADSARSEARNLQESLADVGRTVENIRAESQQLQDSVADAVQAKTKVEEETRRLEDEARHLKERLGDLEEAAQSAKQERCVLQDKQDSFAQVTQTANTQESNLKESLAGMEMGTDAAIAELSLKENVGEPELAADCTQAEIQDLQGSVLAQKYAGVNGEAKAAGSDALGFHSLVMGNTSLPHLQHQDSTEVQHPKEMWSALEELQRSLANAEHDMTAPPEAADWNEVFSSLHRPAQSGSHNNQLPPGWRAYFDDHQQRSYYHHAASNVTQWERPFDPLVSMSGVSPRQAEESQQAQQFPVGPSSRLVDMQRRFEEPQQAQQLPAALSSRLLTQKQPRPALAQVASGAASASMRKERNWFRWLKCVAPGIAGRSEELRRQTAKTEQEAPAAVWTSFSDNEHVWQEKVSQKHAELHAPHQGMLLGAGVQQNRHHEIGALSTSKAAPNRAPWPVV